MSIKELKLQDDKDIKKLKQIYESALQQIKKDKCSYLQEIKGLTASELENEFNICYQGKYNSYALVTKNVSVCEEIVKPWYYSPCVASLASQEKDLNLCNNIRFWEWEARGFNEKLNTKDLCYSSFVSYSYVDMSQSEIESVCNKISNIQLKSQCLSLKKSIPYFPESKKVDDFSFNPNSIVATQNGISLSLDDFKYEIKGNDWGKITTIDLSILNKGSNTIHPKVLVLLYDDNSLKEEWTTPKAEIDFDVWSLGVNEHIIKSAIVNVPFHYLNLTKKFKLALTNAYDYNNYALAVVEKAFNATKI